MSKDPNSRSLLALAGSNSLSNPAYKTNSSKSKKQQESNMNFETRRLVMKLTLPRLRKMQALVRGFLVRRQVYPKKLQQYYTAQSIYQLILANAIYKESSQIVLEQITFPKYQNKADQLFGYQGTLQLQLYGIVYQRMAQKYLKDIVQEAVTEKAKYYSRPDITFGFNLRSPEELLLYQILVQEIRRQAKEVAENSVREHADYWRQIRFMEQLIDRNGLLVSICGEVVTESMNQHMAELIVDNLLSKVSLEASQAVSISCFEHQKSNKNQKQLKAIKEEVENQLIQEAILQGILQLNYGVNL